VFIPVSAVFIVGKMATPQERARTVVWVCETKSVTQMQRNFRTHYQKDPPSRNSIIDWKKKFLETGSVSKKSSGRPSTSNDDAECVREALARTPRKSLRTLMNTVKWQETSQK
jgi:transposase